VSGLVLRFGRKLNKGEGEKGEEGRGEGGGVVSLPVLFSPPVLGVQANGEKVLRA